MAEPGRDVVCQRLGEHLELAGRLQEGELVEQVRAVAAVLVEAFAAGRTLFVLGNGGSAADAAHIAAEFVGRCTRDRRALPAVALAVPPAVALALTLTVLTLPVALTWTSPRRRWCRRRWRRLWRWRWRFRTARRRPCS